MTPEALKVLVAAWEAWDVAPSARDRVVRKLAALAAVAGWDWLVLSRRVEEMRREGLSAREAITQAVGEAGCG